MKADLKRLLRALDRCPDLATAQHAATLLGAAELAAIIRWSNAGEPTIEKNYYGEVAAREAVRRAESDSEGGVPESGVDAPAAACGADATICNGITGLFRKRGNRRKGGSA